MLSSWGMQDFVREQIKQQLDRNRGTWKIRAGEWRLGNVTLKEEVSGFEEEAMPSKPLTRALCLVFQRQRDGPQDYDISLQKDWDLIIVMMNTEVLTVRK